MTLAHTTVRRTVAFAAAAALTGGALVAGGTAATADTAIDATGTVTNVAGTPLANIDVAAYTVDTDGTLGRFVDFATTDASGRYNLTDLETVGATGQVKLSFTDGNDYGLNARALPYLGAYFGNTQASKASPPVAFTAGASTPVANTQLEQAAGITVRVLNPAGVPVNDYGSASVIDPRANLGYEFGDINTASTLADDFAYPAPAVAPKDGVVVFDDLEGGRPVKVLAGGNDVDAAGNEVYYLSQFLGGGFSFDKATTITPVAGKFQDYTVQLSNTFKPTQKPRILGDTTPGKTLTADSGVWPFQANTAFSYQWLRGSTVVSTLDTYTLTKADKKKKIRLVITAVSGDFVSQVSVSSAKVGEKAKLKVSKAGADQLRATVKVAKKSKAKKVGKIKGKVVAYDELGAQVSNKAKVKGGTAILKLRDAAEGKLTVVYLGGGKLGSDSASVKLGGGKGGKGKKN